MADEIILKNLDNKVNQLEQILLMLIDRTDKEKFYSDADTAGVRKSVGDITPYTETKTAYIEDTEITFSNIPSGNITVYFPYEYSMEKEYNRLTITFEPLEEVTDITISIL